MAVKRPSAKAIVLLLAVFVLGSVVGGLGTYLAGHVRSDHHRQRIIDRLSQQLDLTPTQTKQVQQILDEGHQRWTAVFKQSQEQARPQYDAVHAETRARIRAILTPAQQTKFDAFLQRLDAEHKAREKQQGQSH